MKNLLFIISVLTLNFQLSLSGQDFDANFKKGCDSLTVQFNYTGFASVTSVNWTFGDGNVSTEASPQHTYSKPGDYTVTLTINNGTPLEKLGFIQVGRTPSGFYYYADPFGSNGVEFRAMNQDAAPFPYSFLWEFPDGSTETQSKFTHQFDSAGTYNVQLIVTDAIGCADTITQAVDVRNTLNVPNVFTPNGDDNNDLFIIYGDGVTTYKISVFTRSGLKVFESSAKTIIWDGIMASGEKARDGIFYYVIESVDSAEKLKQTGFFYIYGSNK